MPFFGPIVQTPQQLIPIAQTPAPLDLNDIQGAVLIGLQKKAQRLVFFTINDVALFKSALRTLILPRLVTCAEAHRREGELRDHKLSSDTDDIAGGWSALVEMCGINIAFGCTTLPSKPARAEIPLYDRFCRIEYL